MANKYVNGVAENIKGIVARQDVSKNTASNTIPFVKLMESFPKAEDGGKLKTAIQEAIESSKGKENELKAALKLWLIILYSKNRLIKIKLLI